MKLTNTQLNVLVRTLWTKIETKINSLRGTAEYNTAQATAKVAIEYDTKLEYSTKSEKLRKQIKALQDKRDSLEESYHKKFDSPRYWDIPSKDALDESLDKATIEILASSLPSKEDLESDIVLAAMAPGATDIITTLTAKYDL